MDYIVIVYLNYVTFLFVINNHPIIHILNINTAPNAVDLNSNKIWHSNSDSETYDRNTAFKFRFRAMVNFLRSLIWVYNKWPPKTRQFGNSELTVWAYVWKIRFGAIENARDKRIMSDKGRYRSIANAW